MKLIDNIVKHYISTSAGMVIWIVSTVLFFFKYMELTSWLAAMGVGTALFLFNEDWLKKIFGK